VGLAEGNVLSRTRVMVFVGQALDLGRRGPYAAARCSTIMSGSFTRAVRRIKAVGRPARRGWGKTAHIGTDQTRALRLSSTRAHTRSSTARCSSVPVIDGLRVVSRDSRWRDDRRERPAARAPGSQFRRAVPWGAAPARRDAARWQVHCLGSTDSEASVNFQVLHRAPDLRRGNLDIHHHRGPLALFKLR